MMDLAFNKNEDHNKLARDEVRQRLEKIKRGGGDKALEKLHSQGKLSARERIDYLLDKNKPFLEIGAFAAEDMYQEYGGCPSAGVVVVIGYVRGRQVIVVANDAVYSSRFRMKSSLIRNTSGVSSATMPR